MNHIEDRERRGKNKGRLWPVAVSVIGVQVPVEGKKVHSKESQDDHFSERGGHSDNWHGKIKYIFIKCQIADEMGPIH